MPGGIGRNPSSAPSRPLASPTGFSSCRDIENFVINKCGMARECAYDPSSPVGMMEFQEDKHALELAFHHFEVDMLAHP